MAICKEGEVYRAVVYLHSVKVDSKSGFKSRAAAKRWHDDRKADLRHEDPQVLAEANRLTFDDLLSRFETRHIPNLKSPRSRALYELEIRLRIRPFFAYRRLRALTSTLIEDFRDEYRDTPKVGNYALRVLRTILGRGVVWRMLPANPFPKDFAWLPAEREPIRWWDNSQDIQRFLAFAKARSSYYPLFLLGLETGMRFGELAGLWKGDLDFEAGRIHVQRQWDSRKGAKAYRLPKHGKKRWLDFEPDGELAAELRKACMRSTHPELIFPSKVGHPLGYRKVMRGLERVIHKAQVPEVGLHGLRHTFASWYMRVHDDVWALSALLGHASVSTTERIYAHHSPRSRKKPLSVSQMAAAECELSQSSPNLEVISGGKS